MKTFYLLLFTICLAATALAQNKKTVYLVMEINRAYDADLDKHYFKIDAEAENPNAQCLYNLVAYKPKLKKAGGPGFYFSHTDTAMVFFNYFRNESEAIQFVEAQAWQLYSINNRVYTLFHETVSSNYYYFKKEL